MRELDVDARHAPADEDVEVIESDRPHLDEHFAVARFRPGPALLELQHLRPSVLVEDDCPHRGAFATHADAGLLAADDRARGMAG